MRKISKESVSAFLNGKSFCKGNMSVHVRDENVSLNLHGNTIAEKRGNHIYISNARWTTNTTKERLNALLSELNKGYIFQKQRIWYWTVNEKTIEFPYGEFVFVEHYLQYII